MPFKKKTAPVVEHTVSADLLDKVVALIAKRSKRASAVVRLDDPRAYEPVERVIPTGLPALDAVFGVGGLPGGKIIHISGINSDYWVTADADQEKVADVQRDNPLFNLGDDYKPQAFEAFGNGVNGWPVMGLFNAAGKRQDVAPPNIASDSTSPFADRNVHVNLSCIRCHTERAMQPIDDWVRSGIN